MDVVLRSATNFLSNASAITSTLFLTSITSIAIVLVCAAAEVLWEDECVNLGPAVNWAAVELGDVVTGSFLLCHVACADTQQTCPLHSR